MTDLAPIVSPPHSRLDRARAIVPGLLLALAIAVAATALATVVPLVGGPVCGIVIGVVLRLVLGSRAILTPGIAFSSRFVLQLSVVILGSQLSLAQAAGIGLESLPVLVGTLVICLVAAWLIGRGLGVVGDLRTLIGVGTGICGASAIAAVTPVIGAVSADVAYAVSTIFLFNITAVIVFPLLGHALGLSQHAFGLFAGTAVNDTSSVVAAASSYGAAATQYAVVVKLVRTLAIVPISVGLALIGRRAAVRGAAGQDDGARADGGRPAAGALRVTRLVPWFLVGFTVVAAVNSTGAIPMGAHAPLATASSFLITTALSAIGLSTDLAGFRKAGPRPLLLGASLWVVVSLSSLALQRVFGLI
jgi:uncharacterized integral membrane protein (TIGR00698 family)